MIKFDPKVEPDKVALSKALNVGLTVLTKKCRGFTALQFSQEVELSCSELSRMKLFFKNPIDTNADSICCLPRMQKVLTELFVHFPELIIWKRNDGEFRANFRIGKLNNLQNHPLLSKSNHRPRGRPRKHPKNEDSKTALAGI